MKRVKVVLADDHPVTRLGLKAALSLDPRIELVGEAVDGNAAMDACRKLHPDVLLLDIRLPTVDGFAVLEWMKKTVIATRAILITGVGTVEHARRGMELGAYGFLWKKSDPRFICDAIVKVNEGKRVVEPDVAGELATVRRAEVLSPRERDVLVGLAKGQTNREIAAELGVAETTVRTHVNGVFSKLGVSDRTEAVSVAYQRGLLDS